MNNNCLGHRINVFKRHVSKFNIIIPNCSKMTTACIPYSIKNNNNNYNYIHLSTSTNIKKFHPLIINNLLIIMLCAHNSPLLKLINYYVL